MRNAFSKPPELWGQVVQQGGSRALIPQALEGTDKGRIHAVQGPAIAFPGQKSWDGVRPTARLLDTEREALESFEALMGLGNLASQNSSLRRRVCKDANVIQYIENYKFEDHELTRREAVQCWTSRCHAEEMQEAPGGSSGHREGPGGGVAAGRPSRGAARAASSRGLQGRGSEEQGPPGSRASESFQQQGPSGARERGARTAEVKSF